MLTLELRTERRLLPFGTDRIPSVLNVTFEILRELSTSHYYFFLKYYKTIMTEIKSKEMERLIFKNKEKEKEKEKENLKKSRILEYSGFLI